MKSSKAPQILICLQNIFHMLEEASTFFWVFLPQKHLQKYRRLEACACPHPCYHLIRLPHLEPPVSTPDKWWQKDPPPLPHMAARPFSFADIIWLCRNPPGWCLLTRRCRPQALWRLAVLQLVGLALLIFRVPLLLLLARRVFLSCIAGFIYLLMPRVLFGCKLQTTAQPVFPTAAPHFIQHSPHQEHHSQSADMCCSSFTETDQLQEHMACGFFIYRAPCLLEGFNTPFWTSLPFQQVY